MSQFLIRLPLIWSVCAFVQECTTEALFGTMEKTLKLLEMGFSENEVSTVIDKFGE